MEAEGNKGSEEERIGKVGRWVKKPLVAVGFWVVCGLAAMALAVAASWLPLQPFGARWMLGLSMVSILGGLGFIVVGMTGLLGALFKRTRRKSFFLIACSVFIVGGTFWGLRLGGTMRTHEFQRLGERSEFLVKAVKEFERTENRIPADWHELVPEFLPEIPRTGMGAYPNYGIISEKHRRDLYGNDWIIEVECPVGVLNWDIFIFFPNQNYPEYGFGGYLKVLGEWAYVVE